MSLLPPVVGCLLKKGSLRGGGGGAVKGTPGLAQAMPLRHVNSKGAIIIATISCTYQLEGLQLCALLHQAFLRQKPEFPAMSSPYQKTSSACLFPFPLLLPTGNIYIWAGI